MMAGEAAKLKWDGSSATQKEKETECPTLGAIFLNEEAELSSSSVSSEPNSSGETDSEANSTSDPDANAKVNADAGDDPQMSLYSPLAGDSDNELDEVEIFFEETISLLAHEILCCEGDSDSEAEAGTETDGEDTDEAKDNGKLEDILEYNPYQLMFSEEDDEETPDESLKTEDSLPILLLDEDQQSEEKPEVIKEGGFY